MQDKMLGNGPQESQNGVLRSPETPATPPRQPQASGLRCTPSKLRKTPHDFSIEKFSVDNGASGRLPVTPDEWTPKPRFETPVVLCERRVGITKDIHAFRLMEYLYGLHFLLPKCEKFPPCFRSVHNKGETSQRGGGLLKELT